MGGWGERLTLNTSPKPHSLQWNFVFSQKFLRALRARTKKCASQYEAFRGEIRKVGLAKKVAKNKENRYLAYPRSNFFSVGLFPLLLFSLHSQNMVRNMGSQRVVEPKSASNQKC